MLPVSCIVSPWVVTGWMCGNTMFVPSEDTLWGCSTSRHCVCRQSPPCNRLDSVFILDWSQPSLNYLRNKENSLGHQEFWDRQELKMRWSFHTWWVNQQSSCVGVQEWRNFLSFSMSISSPHLCFSTRPLPSIQPAHANLILLGLCYLLWSLCLSYWWFSPRGETELLKPSWASPYLHGHGLNPEASRLVASGIGFTTVPRAGWGHWVTRLPVLPGGSSHWGLRPIRTAWRRILDEKRCPRKGWGEGHQDTRSKAPQMAPNRKHLAMTTLVSLLACSHCVESHSKRLEFVQIKQRVLLLSCESCLWVHYDVVWITQPTALGSHWSKHRASSLGLPTRECFCWGMGRFMIELAIQWHSTRPWKSPKLFMSLWTMIQQSVIDLPGLGGFVYAMTKQQV